MPDQRRGRTRWLPLHHALEQLCLLIIGPRIVEHIRILRLRGDGSVLGRLWVGKGSRCRAGSGLLPGRHLDGSCIQSGEGESRQGRIESGNAKVYRLVVESMYGQPRRVLK